jgi:hypothetical protein
VRAVLRHQILEGPAVVEAGKLIVVHVDLEGQTDSQSARHMGVLSLAERAGM